MLTFLSVKNFAIIENIEVSFESGMTAVTGETGAGKSLLIDAIGLLIGDRATSNIVRTGKDKATVEGIFTYENAVIDQLCTEYDCVGEPGELIIKRQVTPTNNNTIRINNTIVSLTQLKSIASHLADIHTQFDTQRLINPETYLQLIDHFDGDAISTLLDEYNEALGVYKKELKELKRLEHQNNELLDKQDLLQFHKEELEAFHLDKEEEDTLTEQIASMKNYDDIYHAIHSSKTLIEESFALERIYDAFKELSSIAKYKEEYETISKRIEGLYYELDDAFEQVSELSNDLDFSPQLLDDYETRLYQINQLKRKYRKDIPELIDYLETITNDLEHIEDYDLYIEEQKQRVQESFNHVVLKARRVTEKRQAIANKIEQELLLVLDQLELKKVEFKVDFLTTIDDNIYSDGQFSKEGVDQIDFLISLNVGEPLKPLSKTSSGGEMSRIMLGFKNLLLTNLNLSLVIFDEIDTGVSGYVASQVARNMKELSEQTQVICITHIPQVASHATHHLRISKSIEGDRTFSHINKLDYEDRINEIASMISAEEITASSKEAARELLNQNLIK